MTETFYDVLGVAPDADAEAIRTAYRRRLKESHPDRNDADDADEETRRIVRARDVLTDEAERERYDRVGHATYVGDSTGGDAAADDGDGDHDGDDSAAARAARRSGWGSDRRGARSGASDSDVTDETRTGDADGGRSTGSSRRRRSRDRRRRERAARERVRAERDADDGRSIGDDGPRAGDGGAEAAGATRTGTDAESANRTGSGEPRASSNGAAARPSGRRRTGGFGVATPAWAGDGGYDVRREADRGVRPGRLFPVHRSLPLLGMTFVLFPVMVYSAVFAPFPLAVRVVVALCAVSLVAFLQSVPEVGVVVFGAWSLIVPALLLQAGVDLASLEAVVAVTWTALPFGLSVLSFLLVRP